MPFHRPMLSLQIYRMKLCKTRNKLLNGCAREQHTYLLKAMTHKPKNYRPIFCLSRNYKLLTSVLTDRTYSHLEQNYLFPLEQKGCRRGSYGCKDKLLINKMILENCKKRK